MENKRDYIKFTIPNGRSGVVYIGVTNVPELEREKFRNILGSRIVTLSKKGRRTTKDAAERWKKNELEAYASAHNGQYPVYNRSELMPSALIQNFNPMQVSIKNVGIVKDATLDLSKKLIIFCGPNNTGKTYISYIVNALILSSGFYAGRADYVIEKSENPADIVFSFNIEKRSVIESRREQCSDVERHFDSIFGISRQQANAIFPEASVQFIGEEEVFWQYVKHRKFDHWVTYLNYDVHIVKQEDDIRVRVEIKNAAKDKDDRLFASYYNVSDIIATTIMNYPYCNAVMFPVERNSIYTFSKELSINRNLLIDEIQNGGRRFSPTQMIRKRSTRYPKAVRDTLSVAEDMVNLKMRRGEYYSFADKLEKEFLHGKIDTGKDGDVLFVSGGKSYPIHLSASIVKTLSSLTFYLRHLAKRDDLVIIDEPELNLHPDSQIALARLFAKMINNGLRLLISTHSDYIIRELNNLIMISSPKGNVIQEAVKCGYDVNEEALSPNEVGAYLFRQGTDSLVAVDELQVEEDGFSVETIDNVIAQLNEQSEELFMHLKYGH